ncbi:6779_t:CDS:10 [Ambispora gerdemannii]|uniref:6779_t:CDS:1 n=1 Tax=Ambispora gerdemannii TaxID=144530 RepID=A0A9N9F2S5_9GLOM|nr:6779_t:CDS:10 [Ambispora gerdemannii]
MALQWVDRHRPTSLNELSFHSDLSQRLGTLASDGDFPHLLVYGPSGSGKKTRINCVIKELFGEGVEKIKVEERLFQTPSNKKLPFYTVSSIYHLEMTPSEVGFSDRVVIQDLLKEIAQTPQLDSNAKHQFKVVVINEADALSHDAQAALRRTMEKYMANLRVILCCNSSSKIISPIRSRCLLVRVGAPSVAEVMKVLHIFSNKENFVLSSAVAEKIAEESDGNLRKAILMLESLKFTSGNDYPRADTIVKLDWEVYISDIAKAIIANQSETNLESIRKMFYQLIFSCIEPSLIIKTLAFELVKYIEHEDVKCQIILEAADCEHRLHLGQKKIFYLEAFAIKTMHIYKW